MIGRSINAHIVLYICSPCDDLLSMTLCRSCLSYFFTGGLVDNYLLSREGFNKYFKLPDLDTMRGELVTILGSSASLTHTLLGNQQLLLSVNLQQYVKQSQDNGDVC